MPSGFCRKQRIDPRIVIRSSRWETCSGERLEPLTDVRFGSKADICSAKRHVRFTFAVH